MLIFTNKPREFIKSIVIWDFFFFVISTWVQKHSQKSHCPKDDNGKVLWKLLFWSLRLYSILSSLSTPKTFLFIYRRLDQFYRYNSKNGSPNVCVDIKFSKIWPIHFPVTHLQKQSWLLDKHHQCEFFLCSLSSIVKNDAHPNSMQSL